MLRHIVMYKLKPECKGKEQELVNKFLSMKEQIPELINVHSGMDIIKSPRSFDVALICDFNSLEDLEIYLSHPYHLTVRDLVKSITQSAHSVDYTL